MGRLCLTRKVNEMIEIVTPSGEVIEITFTEFEPNKVRFVISADRSFKINRLDKDGNLQTGQGPSSQGVEAEREVSDIEVLPLHQRREQQTERNRR